MINYLKENVGFTIMINNEASEIEIIRFQKELEASRFAKSTSFITKQQATHELKKDLGEDFITFLGYSPLLSSIDVKLNASYANTDSLQRITNELTKSPVVFETYYQKNLKPPKSLVL